MQSILHELPYNPRGWTHGDFAHADLGRRLKNRVVPWPVLAEVMGHGFCVSVPAQYDASVVVAGPGTRAATYGGNVLHNYVLSKQVQRSHLSATPDQRVVLVELAPRENESLLAVFFAAVHLALDARGDQEPSSVPHLVFACQAPFLNRLQAAAHYMDVYNTRIPEATFDGAGASRDAPAPRPTS